MDYKLLIIGTIAIVLFSTQASACLNLTGLTTINESTTFCKGIYHINDVDNEGAIQINGSNIDIDCNGSTLFSNYNCGTCCSDSRRGIAFYNKYLGENITYRNCHVEGYSKVIDQITSNSKIINFSISNSTTISGCTDFQNPYEDVFAVYSGDPNFNNAENVTFENISIYWNNQFWGHSGHNFIFYLMGDVKYTFRKLNILRASDYLLFFDPNSKNSTVYFYDSNFTQFTTPNTIVSSYSADEDHNNRVYFYNSSLRDELHISLSGTSYVEIWNYLSVAINGPADVLNNTQIKCVDRLGNIKATNYTTQGQINDINLLHMNKSVTSTTYLSNYTVYAWKEGYITNYTQVNMSNSNSIAIDLGIADYTAPTPASDTKSNGKNYIEVNVTVPEAGANLAYLEWDNVNITMFKMSDYNFYINLTETTEANYTYKVYINDTQGKWSNTSPRNYEITNSVPDTTPPEIYIVVPAEGQSYGSATNQINVLINTNEKANISWSFINSGFSQDNLLDNTGGYTHIGTISPLTSGNTYTLYFWGNDSSGNVNQEPKTVSFSIEERAGGGGGGGGVEEREIIIINETEFKISPPQIDKIFLNIYRNFEDKLWNLTVKFNKPVDSCKSDMFTIIIDKESQSAQFGWKIPKDHPDFYFFIQDEIVCTDTSGQIARADVNFRVLNPFWGYFETNSMRVPFFLQSDYFFKLSPKKDAILGIRAWFIWMVSLFLFLRWRNA